jgi:hypothetical protein
VNPPARMSITPNSLSRSFTQKASSSLNHSPSSQICLYYTTNGYFIVSLEGGRIFYPGWSL